MQSSVQQEFQPFGLCQGKNKIFKKYIHKSSEQFPTSTLSPTPSLYNNKQRRSLNFSGSHQNKKKKRDNNMNLPCVLSKFCNLLFTLRFQECNTYSFLLQILLNLSPTSSRIMLKTTPPPLKIVLQLST